MNKPILVATLALAITACGPKLERAVNAVFATAPVAVNELELDGVITAELAGELRVDIPDGKRVTDNLIQDLKAIPKDAPDRRARQLTAWQNAELAWLAIVNRGHFALNDKMQKFAARANSLFAAGVQVFGGISAQKSPEAAPVPPNLNDDQIEKLLLERLESLQKSLE